MQRQDQVLGRVSECLIVLLQLHRKVLDIIPPLYQIEDYHAFAFIP